MKKILKIVSSVKGAASKSTQLADAIVEKLLVRYPGSVVTVKDLAEQQYAHFHTAHLKVFRGMGDATAEAAQEVERVSDEAINEVMNADIIVIGVAVYNHHIPSTLKSWLDHVVRAGKTFSFATGQLEGLIKDKTVYLAVASGSVYSEGPGKAMDFAAPYLQAMFGFLGVTDVRLFRAEGCDMPGLAETALQKGIASIVL